MQKRHGDLYSLYRNTIWCFETKKNLLCNMTSFMAKNKTKNTINETYHDYVSRPKLDGSKQTQNDNYYL